MAIISRQINWKPGSTPIARPYRTQHSRPQPDIYPLVTPLTRMIRYLGHQPRLLRRGIRIQHRHPHLGTQTRRQVMIRGMDQAQTHPEIGSLADHPSIQTMPCQRHRVYRAFRAIRFQFQKTRRPASSNLTANPWAHSAKYAAMAGCHEAPGRGVNRADITAGIRLPLRHRITVPAFQIRA